MKSCVKIVLGAVWSSPRSSLVKDYLNALLRLLFSAFDLLIAITWMDLSRPAHTQTFEKVAFLKREI